MKLSPKTFLVVSLLAAGGQTAFSEAAKNAPAKPAPVHSEFRMPTNVHEGRDPFYPESPRPYESVVAASRPVEINSLAIKGFSGTAARRLVIINNHTFAAGDETDVLSLNGRVHVRCVEIRGDVAVIEVNGQKRELHFGVK